MYLMADPSYHQELIYIALLPSPKGEQHVYSLLIMKKKIESDKKNYILPTQVSYLTIIIKCAFFEQLRWSARVIVKVRYPRVKLVKYREQVRSHIRVYLTHLKN